MVRVNTRVRLNGLWLGMPNTFVCCQSSCPRRVSKTSVTTCLSLHYGVFTSYRWYGTSLPCCTLSPLLNTIRTHYTWVEYPTILEHGKLVFRFKLEVSKNIHHAKYKLFLHCVLGEVKTPPPPTTPLTSRSRPEHNAIFVI